MDRERMISLLDPPTIVSLLKVYNLGYKNLALLFRCTRQNVVHLLKYNKLSKYQKKLVLELFEQYGLEAAELVLIHYMTKKANQLT